MHWLQSCILDLTLLSLVVVSLTVHLMFTYMFKHALKMAGPSLLCSVPMKHSPLYCDLLDWFENDTFLND